MNSNQNPIQNQPLTGSTGLVIVQGVIQNLPEILETFKEIYKIYDKGQKFDQYLQVKLTELNINKENFKVLVESLTELSKSEHADSETKALYRDMISTLFKVFVLNMQNSKDFSNYMKDL